MRNMQLSRQKIRRIALILLVIATLAIRYVSHGGEFYALHVYPAVSYVLSLISSICPWSLDEAIVIGWALAIIIYPFVAHRKGQKARQICGMEIEFCGWIFVWFYMGWGCNYYRDNIFTRAQVQPVEVDSVQLVDFLHKYTDNLNHSYVKTDETDKDKIEEEIKELYKDVPSHLGLALPHSFQKPKKLIFNLLYSSVGVSGYMGPFACESHINEQILPYEYPFVYAHELSHLLGVSNEGEANYWAYRICTKAKNKRIRYAGYYCILPNVARTARTFLSDEEYSEWIKSIDARILEDRKEHERFWAEHLSPWISDIQDYLFNLLLKSNRIYSGTKNYDTVIEMIISLDEQG